jgi:hypothetical protein
LHGALAANEQVGLESSYLLIKGLRRGDQHLGIRTVLVE